MLIKKKKKLESAIIWKLVTCQQITSKNTRPRWVDTWALDTDRWYWPADTLFWQLSIDHIIDVKSVFSWASKLARKCDSIHWFPVVRTDHVISKFSEMGRFTYPWCSSGVRFPRARAPLTTDRLLYVFQKCFKRISEAIKEKFGKNDKDVNKSCQVGIKILSGTKLVLRLTGTQVEPDHWMYPLWLLLSCCDRKI